MSGRSWNRMALAAALLLAASPFAAQAAEIPDCERDRCGLLADGAYPNLVVGTLSHIASEAELHRVYDWAKAHGYWKSLPNHPAPYLASLKLVTITLPGRKQPVTVFMQQEEFRSAPYVEGDLVRYTPHDGLREIPPGDADHLALYHGLSGCVATLCRREDAACFKRYLPGIFTLAHGESVNPATGAIQPHGSRIDPVSLLPAH